MTIADSIVSNSFFCTARELPCILNVNQKQMFNEIYTRTLAFVWDIAYNAFFINYNIIWALFHGGHSWL